MSFISKNCLYLFQSIEGAIGGNAYQHNKVNQWTSNVVEQCLNQLTKLAKPFKYIGKSEIRTRLRFPSAAFMKLTNCIMMPNETN
jgi:hypothetical protein